MQMNPQRMKILKVSRTKNTQLIEKRLIGLNHDPVRENPSTELRVTPSTIGDILANTTESTLRKKENIIHQDIAQTTDIVMKTDIEKNAMRQKTGKKGMGKNEKKSKFTNHDWSSSNQ